VIVPDSLSTLTLRRVFNAPRERVFDAWVNPVKINGWLGRVPLLPPETTVDLRVGGRYRVALERAEIPDRFYVVGTFQEVEPPARLVYTWSFEGAGMDPTPTLITVEFRPLEGATEVLLTHEQIPTAEMRESFAGGWAECFGLMEGVV
jgi:uncharacterized protein YndB with AHSA1/START domain